MTRVLLMNDNPALRRSLRRLLETSPGLAVVGEVALTVGAEGDGGPGRGGAGGGGSVEEGEALSSLTGQVDVVVVDVGMDVGRAAKRVEQLRQELGAVRVIATTMMPEPDATQRLCEAGAEAVLDKAGPVSSLIEAIRGRPAD